LARPARSALPAGLARPAALWTLLAVAALLIVTFAGLIARHLTRDARRTSQSYARVFRALATPGEDAATEALLQQAREIRAEGIPIVVTNSAGIATDTANLPAPMAFDSPELRAFVATLDRGNPPVVEPAVGTIHFGAPPVRRYLRLVFALMVITLVTVLGTGYLASRSTVRAHEDRMFVAMARESAHQLGTPLTSLAGWIEALRERAEPEIRDIAEHLAGDYRRLDRISRRFERIGQPPRSENVDVGALAVAAAQYFRPRLPRLANTVVIDLKIESRAPVVLGDSLLLEWALEALVKNAVDALKGRSGTITISVADEPEHVLLAVEDDGPGVPHEVTHKLFEPGVTTKTSGWGLGLSLTRRIAQDGFGGQVVHEPTPEGARFVLRLPRAEAKA